jgi:hypothetical protein
MSQNSHLLHQNWYRNSFTKTLTMLYGVWYHYWCTNFDAPNAHFDYLSLFSGTRAEKVENPKTKNCENCIRRKNQILCYEIERNPLKDRAMHEGDNRSFWDEFIKFTFILKEWCRLSINVYKFFNDFCWVFFFMCSIVQKEFCSQKLKLEPHFNVSCCRKK